MSADNGNPPPPPPSYDEVVKGSTEPSALNAESYSPYPPAGGAYGSSPPYPPAGGAYGSNPPYPPANPGYGAQGPLHAYGGPGNGPAQPPYNTPYSQPMAPHHNQGLATYTGPGYNTYSTTVTYPMQGGGATITHPMVTAGTPYNATVMNAGYNTTPAAYGTTSAVGTEQRNCKVVIIMMCIFVVLVAVINIIVFTVIRS